MLLLPHDQACVDEFLKGVEPFLEAYKHRFLTYLATKSGDNFALARARVFLSVNAPVAPFSHFKSTNVRAGRYNLSELRADVRALIGALVSGKITTPDGDLLFPGADGRYGVSFIPFHPEGLQRQLRLNILSVIGAQDQIQPHMGLDWELKASTTPYDGLQELMSEYQLGPLSPGPAQVEVIALNVAEVDTARSRVNGTKAEFHVALAAGLPRDKFRVGYRVLHQGHVFARATIDPGAIDWSALNGWQLGRAVVEVPNAAVVNAVTSFDGVAQHHWWFSDPATFQNTRRAVYEAFDPKLEKLRDVLEKAQGRGQDARQLEPAVAWVMWMLGFAVAHLGGNPRMQDAVDVIATSPRGNFAVLECTTGLLRADNKLAILHDRAEAVRRSLANSNQAFLRVISIIVTTKTKAEIKPELEHAEKGGVLVITRDEFNQLIDRTLALPDADKLYADAEDAIRAAQEKHESQPSLPLMQQ